MADPTDICPQCDQSQSQHCGDCCACPGDAHEDLCGFEGYGW